MSKIDNLQRLHEETTKGEWRRRSNLEHDIESDSGLVVGNYDWEEGGCVHRKDRDFIVELHNAWPDIYRVLLAAKMLIQCPRCVGPCDDPTVHAEIAEALQTLDGKVEAGM